MFGKFDKNQDSKDYMVEKHVVDSNHVFFKQIDDYSFKAKNLFNVCTYELRQEYFRNKEAYELDPTDKKQLSLLKGQNLYHLVKTSDSYKAMNQKISKLIVGKCIKSWFEHFALVKDFIKRPQKYKGRPGLPRYKDKQKGRCSFVCDMQVVSTDKKYLKDSRIHIPTLGITFHTKVPYESIVHVEVVALNATCYSLNVVYDFNKRREIEKNFVLYELDSSLYMSCDLGVNNLCALTSNKGGFQPLIVNGGYIKSLNQYYNKRKAELQSKLPDKVRISKKILKLGNKRRNRIEHEFHKIANYIVNECLVNGIGNLVIGNNDDWKQKVDNGKRNNQNFVSIPFEKLIQYLKYKCFKVGINFMVVDEAYTSKSSLLDLDSIPDYVEGVRHRFSGYRESNHTWYKRRGIKGKNARIHADVQGSYNILRKYLPNLFSREGLEALSVVPRRVTL
jgi:putative transposase